jgi:hypothetical protein
MHRTAAGISAWAAVGLVVGGTGVASASLVMLSDDFNRVAGNNNPDAGPLVSSWGTNNNGLGGTLSGGYTANWETTGSDINTDFVDGVGVLQFDRTILNVNLATTQAVSAGGVIVQYDINPGNALAGRDWGGVGLADTNVAMGAPSPAGLGGRAGMANQNRFIRFAALPRNSGTVLTKRATGADTFEIRAGGIPGSLTESIFDQQTWDEYVAARAANGNSDAGLVFERELWYTVQLVVRESAPGNLFAPGATNFIELYIARQGEPLVRIDPNPDTAAIEDTLIWGASDLFQNASDPINGRMAYLAFAGNANFHQFDNLIVSVIPEPASLALLGLGGLLAMGRRRKV